MIKIWAIKNGTIVEDGAKVIEANILVRISPCDPHHKIGEVLLTNSPFFLLLFYSIFIFDSSFCSSWFVLVFLDLFCRLSIACYIENKIEGRDWKGLILLIIFCLWSNCWGNEKSRGKSTNSIRTKQWQFSLV